MWGELAFLCCFSSNYLWTHFLCSHVVYGLWTETLINPIWLELYLIHSCEMNQLCCCYSNENFLASVILLLLYFSFLSQLREFDDFIIVQVGFRPELIQTLTRSVVRSQRRSMNFHLQISFVMLLENLYLLISGSKNIISCLVFK